MFLIENFFAPFVVSFFFVNFVLLYFKMCAPRANLITTQNISDSEVPPAKARRAPSSDNYFLCGLCVFAGDIPNLRLRLGRAGSFVVSLLLSFASAYSVPLRWIVPFCESHFHVSSTRRKSWPSTASSIAPSRIGTA